MRCAKTTKPLGQGGVLRGDVDGDGAVDRGSIRFDPRASTQCGFLLVVRTRSRRITAIIPERYSKNQVAGIAARNGYVPRLDALVLLDRRRGYELAVEVSRGASDVFLALFAVRGRRMVRFRAPTFDGRIEAEFSAWGSVGHNHGLDCARGPGSGYLFVSGAGPDGRGGWIAGRQLLLLKGTIYRLVRSSTLRTRSEARIARRYPEIGRRPLVHCSPIRNPEVR